MTALEIFGVVVVIVAGSFIAGFVETWLEQRKWNKKKGAG